LSFIY